jgi:prepilin peptidase CpaA
MPPPPRTLTNGAAFLRRLTFGAWLVALPVQMTIHGLAAGASAWALGWLTGLASSCPFTCCAAWPLATIKLMAAVGAWLGASLAASIALASFVIGGVWALTLVLASGKGRQVVRNIGGIALTGQGGTSVGSLPYGVAIAAGTLTMLFAST